MNILIINGPNLNLLGVRERSIYGSQSMEDFLQTLTNEFPKLNIAYYQSNSEGELINKLHDVGFDIDGIVLNAGAYTHTSVALADAISAIKSPVIEVHISNTAKREDFRHKSFISSVCLGTIAGFGMDSYRLGIEALIRL